MGDDIKPHNVMLTPRQQVKVVDFGIAGFLQTAFTLAHSSQLTPAGTPEYGAPEQFLAERGDARSDLYALGGLLFAMLTGPNAMAVVRRKLDEDAPRLDALRPDLPTALTDLVAALLARDPTHRPQTATEVLRCIRDLQAAPTIEPASVTVPGPAMPRTAPEEGEVRLSWSGEEPLKSYARLQKVWPFWLAFLVSSVVTAAVTPILIHFAPPPGSDPQVPVLGLIIILIGGLSTTVALLTLLGAPIQMIRNAMDARVRCPRSRWRLIVNNEGITVTSKVGSETFLWAALALALAAIKVIDSRSPHDYSALVVDLDPAGPPHALQRPAGWHYRIGYLPMNPRTGVPVCVLGPMTERQRGQLIRSLITYAGPAWDPKTVFVTRPINGQ
ncbi:serine/threonine protein kinase [Kitasatospora xanthocidica]|uniref:serine/threonine protein kinase n=1 Tax=Kitasatospora xanthocidica TaxID=83382 RepID=UPI0036EB2553